MPALIPRAVEPFEQIVHQRAALECQAGRLGFLIQPEHRLGEVLERTDDVAVDLTHAIGLRRLRKSAPAVALIIERWTLEPRG